jgi:hypothetical protein
LGRSFAIASSGASSFEPTGNKYHSAPYDIMWWKPVGCAQVYATPPDHITFPISIKDESIPDEVLAKATEIILRGGL